MTTTTQRPPGFFEQHHFLLRRLHSLTGVVPIGVFLLNHLLTNSSLVWGKFGLRGEGAGMDVQDGGTAYFQKEVTWINEQIPHLLLIEITLWVSIAFHSILGIYYAKTGKFNTERYGYRGNWRYTLQRVSGYVGILFILYHVATLRWGWTWLVPGGAEWSHQASVSTLACVTRHRDEANGSLIQIDNSQLVRQEAIGRPHGTTMTIEHLFGKVPARLKFLKSNITERGHIDGIVTRYALAYPHIRFTLTHDGRTTLQTNGSGDVRDVLIETMGADDVDKMVAIQRDQTQAITVEGYIGLPTAALIARAGAHVLGVEVRERAPDLR